MVPFTANLFLAVFIKPCNNHCVGGDTMNLQVVILLDSCRGHAVPTRLPLF
jgi:hypothetical protein